ncbi:glycosyltransferase [Qipengyuania gaetbuli]|uniref:glycosyltransferase n=1 Tax=Qipengyuania gaetbuli TaxID=266952 RepID=UPI001C9988B0|nr:glycosyltransferase [Qipengyuania gaetbuli]MBY6016082.1 glycosyltransferase [Qipengyuania gaetbuli]
MKISIALPNLAGGGAERVNLDLAKEFARAGHNVEFVLMEAKGALLKEAATSFRIVDLKTPRVRALPFPLARYLRERRPDVLLAAMWPLTGLAGLAVLLSRHKTRLIASEHVDFRITPSLKNFEKFLLKKFGPLLYAPSERVIGVSSGVCESLADVARLPSEKISMIYNPIRPAAPDEMNTADRELLSGWLSGKKRLIAIGSLKRQKGFDILIRAMADIREIEEVELLILGEGELREDLQKLADELGIGSHVFLPGFRSNPSTFLHHADCFVLSSNWEGFGNVVVEALGAGVPVVSTNCLSGPAEILADGEFGILTPPGRWKDLGQAIIESLGSSKNPNLLKKRAKDFAPERQAALYLEIFTGS